MKLAIIIGVSDYQNAESLPACKNDAYIINEIISASGKFEAILYLNDNTSSSTVKSLLSKFVSDHSGKEIDELFFYFSGHGIFTNQEFHYALTDIDLDKIKQTSLENSELDQLIRSLSPNLTIKVVDACQSGVDYIKSTKGELEKILQQKTQELKRCYFMFSSNNDQYSYATAAISHFTRFFVESVKSSISGEIRYKEIMDFISDSFSGSNQQTPLFITQANFTEIFVPVDESIRNKISEFLSGFKIPASVAEKKQGMTVLDYVMEDAKRYISKDKAEELLHSIHEKIKSTTNFKGEELDKLFSFLHTFNSTNSSAPNLTQAAEWLDKNNDKYFSKTIWDTIKIKKRVPKLDSITSMNRLLGIGREYEVREVDEDYCVDISNTTELPFSYVIVRAQRNYPNINSCELFFLFFLSETKIAILYGFARSKTTDWDAEISQKEMVKWYAKSFEITDVKSIDSYIDIIFQHFQSFSLEPLLKGMEATLGIEKSESAHIPNTKNPKK